MMTLIAAAVLAAQPIPAGSQPAPKADCCKDCCKDMAKNREGHEMSDHQGHSDH
jgi:hypothetical protein